MNPKGNPNIRNIGRKFDANTARIANKKSHEAKLEKMTLMEIAKMEIGPEKKKEMIKVLWKRVKFGNLKAWELMMEVLGEKPAEKVVIAEVSPEAIKDVEDIVLGDDDDDAQ